MKTLFYEYPNITVCLIIDESRCARGIAIKSPSDKYDKETAQKTAKRHAYMALGKSRQLGAIKNHRAIKTLIASGCPFVHKGELNPILTWQETHLLRLKSPFVFHPQGFTPSLNEIEERAWGLTCTSTGRKGGKTYASNFFETVYGGSR